VPFCAEFEPETLEPNMYTGVSIVSSLKWYVTQQML
jgi:hypothetical protein